MANYDKSTLDILRSTLQSTPSMKEQLRSQFPGAIELIELQSAHAAPQIDLQQVVAAEVAKQLAASQTQVATTPAVDQNAMKAAAFALMRDSLSTEQMDWVVAHVMKGAPGFGNFLTSEEIKTVVQLGFEQYKAFLEK